jgi:hypothetical protein
MFLFRQPLSVRRARLVAFREFWSNYFGDNTCEARGLRLLREWLSPYQREQFEVNGYFDVVGCDTGRKYRIHYGTAMNVHELDATDHIKMGWCFVPHGSLVAGDVMLAQKIALETLEAGALSVARPFVPNTRLGATNSRAAFGDPWR